MWASVDVVKHPENDECEHHEYIGVGLGSRHANPVDEDSTYEEQMLQTVRNLFAADPRMGQGHFYKVEICG